MSWPGPLRLRGLGRLAGVTLILCIGACASRGIGSGDRSPRLAPAVTSGLRSELSGGRDVTSSGNLVDSGNTRESGNVEGSGNVGLTGSDLIWVVVGQVSQTLLLLFMIRHHGYNLGKQRWIREQICPPPGG